MNKEAFEIIKDLAENGTRHDLNPTCISQGQFFEPPRTGGWTGYVKEMDDYVRDRARLALETRKLYPKGAVEDVREQMGMRRDDSSKDEYIQTLPLEEFLNCWCIWNGILGFTSQIIAIVESKS